MTEVLVLNSQVVPQEFGQLANRLLDEYEVADIRVAERLFEILARQGRTEAGFPRVRAIDCSLVVDAIRRAFVLNRRQLQIRDTKTINRLDTLLEAFAQSDVRFYPNESLRIRLLQAELRFFLNDAAGMRDILGDMGDCYYAVEGDARGIESLMWLDGQALALSGEVKDLNRIFLDRVTMLVRKNPMRTWQFATRFAAFLSLGKRSDLSEGLLGYFLQRLSAKIMETRRPYPNPIKRYAITLLKIVRFALMSLCLLILTKGDIRLKRHISSSAEIKDDLLVTRAMGGIGDLLMMTPGLRAAAKKRRRAVKLAVNRKFFPVFANNPHVELIDIEALGLEPKQYRRWVDLTDCPAARYEQKHKPDLKKGRVEVFAAALNVTAAELDTNGWRPEINLDAEQRAFADSFWSNAGFGLRPVLGIQPFSRDAYKDHPEILRIIKDLNEDYDILLFHHIADGLPSGPAIASTAGMSLSQSFALLAKLDAMVSVDSAFLHAAAAFDIPTVAMFGPTDGKVFTRHHRNAVVINVQERFSCSPCWRNEDIPCLVTRYQGTSPCIASITIKEIREGLNLVRKKTSVDHVLVAADA